MKYKAIAKTPFHQIGDIIDTKNYNWNPALYPELFEKIESKTFITEDGFQIESYDEVYIVNSQWEIRQMRYYYSDESMPVFKHRQSAEEYVIDNICIKIENEIITGENIPLYSVCATSAWEINNSTTSLQLFQRLQRTSKPSEHWKFFRTEAERDWYIDEYRPLYSKNDIRNNNYEL